MPDSAVAGRASGILLHPSSLPGPFGIGELGPSAVRFLDFLRSAGQALWQVLPLGPTGFGNSPYACFSSFAGNPLLISMETLVEWGDLLPEELRDAPSFTPGRVDYGRLIDWKLPLLQKAGTRFLLEASRKRRDAFESFRSAEAGWLDDYSLFAALKTRFEQAANAKGGKGGAWNDSWDRDIALRAPEAVRTGKESLAGEMLLAQVVQYFFFCQWKGLLDAAHARGIQIIGDLPIFSAMDSADVWAHRGIFRLDGNGRPTEVSGVPPDYFAATGQLWGNPLYDWKACAAEGFRFWVERIRAAHRLFDFIRIDHFRGFDACWTVPAGDATAEHGTWVKSPGVALFETLENELGALPLIAEDLGVITPGVTALRERFGLPGMRILQFAFDSGEAGTLSPDNRFLPHNHTADSVVYTGTHDNDTTRGWYERRTPEERAFLERYCAGSDAEIWWRLIRMALASVCRFAVVPLQDVLGLGTEARMNTPGTSGGSNWTWRFGEGALTDGAAARLRGLTELYGRCPIAER